MTRTIKKDITATCKTTIEMADFADEPRQWLSEQMHQHNLKFLLAHADDGVIWGWFDGQALLISHDVAPKHSPPLRTATLQTVRIFASTGELLVWRDEDGTWAGRLITETTASDGTSEWSLAFDEQQILWGTNAVSRGQGFALVSEGAQEFFHVVPVPSHISLPRQIDERTRPLRIVVRHYLQEDTYGCTQVNESRLCDLLWEPKESNT